MINKTSTEHYRVSPLNKSQDKNLKEKTEEIYQPKNCEKKLNIWNSFIDNIKVNADNDANESNRLTLSPMIIMQNHERKQKTTFSKYPVKLKYQKNEIANLYKLFPKTMKNNKTNRNSRKQGVIPYMNLLQKQSKMDENTNSIKLGIELEKIHKNLRKNLYCSSLIYQRNPSPPKMHLNVSNKINEPIICSRNKFDK